MRAPSVERNRPPDDPGAVSLESGLAASQFDNRDNKPESDLLQEFAPAVTRAQEVEPHQWLTKRLCISENLLHGIRPEYPEGHPWRMTASLVGVARIEAQGQFWQPVDDDRGGQPALVVPVAPIYAEA